MPKQNVTEHWRSSIRVESSVTPAWIRVGPTKVKTITVDPIWDTSTAGGRTRLEGCMATGSTDITVIVRCLSSARGQKASTGTATKMVTYIRTVSTAGARTSAKGLKLFVASFSTW